MYVHTYTYICNMQHMTQWCILKDFTISLCVCLRAQSAGGLLNDVRNNGKDSVDPNTRFCVLHTAFRDTFSTQWCLIWCGKRDLILILWQKRPNFIPRSLLASALARLTYPAMVPYMILWQKRPNWYYGKRDLILMLWQKRPTIPSLHNGA